MERKQDPVTLLTVHLISEAEYELIRADGLDPLLDLFDERDYPPVFDPKRPSYA
jgi:Suppressor of fused protein (SUFU)